MWVKEEWTEGPGSTWLFHPMPHFKNLQNGNKHTVVANICKKYPVNPGYKQIQIMCDLSMYFATCYLG